MLRKALPCATAVSVVVAAQLACLVAAAPCTPRLPAAPGTVALDFAQLGERFEGLGALSGGGGTSR